MLEIHPTDQKNISALHEVELDDLSDVIIIVPNNRSERVPEQVRSGKKQNNLLRSPNENKLEGFLFVRKNGGGGETKRNARLDFSRIP